MCSVELGINPDFRLYHTKCISETVDAILGEKKSVHVIIGNMTINM
jgi:hypothetical protein